MESRASSQIVSSADGDSSETPGLDGIFERQRLELQNLTLTTQPLKTVKFFILGTLQYIRTMLSTSKYCWIIMAITILAVVITVLGVNIGGPYKEHFKELLYYFQFGLWWLALGVASSIGLGSGLHTFLLYLGPHVAMYTIKAVRCDRIDLKSAKYDTVQWNRRPSWLEKDCSDFGPPSRSSSGDSQVSFYSILLEVQLEGILWGIGTALGELPPYFISSAACASGKKIEVIEELNSSLLEDDSTDRSSLESFISWISSCLKKIKFWLFTCFQHLNFVTILLLASVPNPLFDLAGITCGQFGIPFWKFFTPTLIGKAIIKTHLQIALIILVCNNQLLDLIENKLISLSSFVPMIASNLPKLKEKMQSIKEQYVTPSPRESSNIEETKLDMGSIWNAIVTLMLLNFLMKIITSTAQSFLKDQHQKELAAVTKNSPTLQAD